MDPPTNPYNFCSSMSLPLLVRRTTKKIFNKYLKQIHNYKIQNSDTKRHMLVDNSNI